MAEYEVYNALTNQGLADYKCEDEGSIRERCLYMSFSSLYLFQQTFQKSSSEDSDTYMT